jgi:hypothetical protein
MTGPQGDKRVMILRTSQRHMPRARHGDCIGATTIASEVFIVLMPSPTKVPMFRRLPETQSGRIASFLATTCCNQHVHGSRDGCGS